MAQQKGEYERCISKCKKKYGKKATGDKKNGKNGKNKKKSTISGMKSRYINTLDTNIRNNVLDAANKSKAIRDMRINAQIADNERKTLLNSQVALNEAMVSAIKSKLIENITKNTKNANSGDVIQSSLIIEDISDSIVKKRDKGIPLSVNDFSNDTLAAMFLSSGDINIPIKDRLDEFKKLYKFNIEGLKTGDKSEKIGKLLEEKFIGEKGNILKKKADEFRTVSKLMLEKNLLGYKPDADNENFKVPPSKNEDERIAENLLQIDKNIQGPGGRRYEQQKQEQENQDLGLDDDSDYERKNASDKSYDSSYEQQESDYDDYFGAGIINYKHGTPTAMSLSKFKKLNDRNLMKFNGYLKGLIDTESINGGVLYQKLKGAGITVKGCSRGKGADNLKTYIGGLMSGGRLASETKIPYVEITGSRNPNRGAMERIVINRNAYGGYVIDMPELGNNGIKKIEIELND